MQYLKFRSLARLLFFSSITLVAAFLAFFTSVVLIIILWHNNDQSLAIPIASSAGIFLSLGLLQAILSGRTTCQLCQTPILRDFGCSKSPNAKSFFGSYRLRVALAIIFTGKFRCPYCGEEFKIWAHPKKTTQIHIGNQVTRKAGKSLPVKKKE